MGASVGAERPEILMPEIDFALGDFPDLHELFAELREYGPVVPVKFIGERAWLILGYPELKQAMADEEHFLMAAAYRQHALPVMGHTMETMTGEEHRVNRGLISRSFLPRAVRAMVEPLLESVLGELLDELEGSQETELMAALVKPYPFRVITRLLGVPVDDEERFMEWADVMIRYAWEPAAALEAREEFTARLAPLLAERRANPEDDLISVLVHAEFEGQKLEDEEVFSFCRLLFPAGSDTTYRSYGSLVARILQQPELRQLATGDVQQRHALIEEGLRMEPATATIPRVCSKSTVLGGMAIEEGERAIFGIAGANRDPEVFEQPDRFMPGRTAKHLAFGNGIHVCLGQHFARAELEVGIRLLFQRFPDLRLSPGARVDITGNVVRGPRELRVRLR